MENKKIVIAGLVAVAVVAILLGLSYNKELAEQGISAGIFGNSISRSNPAGTYVAFLRAADTSSRTIVVQLNNDASRTATLTSDYYNAQPPIVDRGTWSTSGSGFSISFTSKNGLNLSVPEVLNFVIGKTTIALVNPDKLTWGSNGLTLTRSPLPLPSEWTWMYTTVQDGTRIVADPQKHFAISLAGDNRMSVRGDCNSVNGSFGLRDNNGIVFGPLGSTRMYCEGSQEDVFMQDLSRSISYKVSGNNLLLTLPNESGVMTFTRSGR